MSDTTQGSGWWQASDGKWYPPETHPAYGSPPPYTPVSSYYANIPLAQIQLQTTKRTNGYAIAGFVLSLLWVLGIGSTLGVIFSVKARHDIRRSSGLQGGEGLAVAGLIISIVGILGATLVWLVILSFGSAINDETTPTYTQSNLISALENANVIYDNGGQTYPTGSGAAARQLSGLDASQTYQAMASGKNNVISVYAPSSNVIILEALSTSSTDCWGIVDVKATTALPLRGIGAWAGKRGRQPCDGVACSRNVLLRRQREHGCERRRR